MDSGSSGSLQRELGKQSPQGAAPVGRCGPVLGAGRGFGAGSASRSSCPSVGSSRKFVLIDRGQNRPWCRSHRTVLLRAQL